MEKIPLTVRNILKMIMWVLLASVFITWFGLLGGIITYIIVVVCWSIVLTAIRAYLNDEKKDLKTILDSIFTTNFSLPFTAYGCYCSPSYGVDGRTNGLEPVDGLDSACKKHDDAMLVANEAFANLAITKPEYIRLKNLGDWTFMKEVIMSENTASGIYLIGLEIGFLFRIISRTITKA